MRRGRLAALIVAIALVAAACNGDDESTATTATLDEAAPDTTTSPVPGARNDVSSPSAGIGADSDAPGALELASDTQAATTAEIGPEGGTLSLTSDTGTFSLDVPAGALLSPVEVTMTPATATGAPLGGNSSPMVVITPADLTFLAPAVLSVDGSDLDGEPVGVAAGSSGDDVFLTPAEATEGSAMIQVTSSQAVGFASRDRLLRSIGAYRPATAEGLARTVVALAGKDHGVAFAAIEVWARSLLTALEGTVTPQRLELATVELASLLSLIDQESRHSAEAGGPAAPDTLREAVDDAIGLWYTQVGTDVETLRGLCADDPAEVVWIHRWVLIGGALGSTFGSDRDEAVQAWSAAVQECLTFEVDWATQVVLDDGEFSTNAVGSAVMAVDQYDDIGGSGGLDRLTVRGGGEWRVTTLTFESCTPVYQAGTAEAFLEIAFEAGAPDGDRTAQLTGLTVGIIPGDRPVVQCQELLDVGSEVEWGGLFYATPITYVNGARVGVAGEPWTFEIELDGTSGEMGSVSTTDSETASGTTANVDQTITVRRASG